MNDNLLGSLFTISTTLLTKNLVNPVLKCHCFFDTKCLSKLSSLNYQITKTLTIREIKKIIHHYIEMNRHCIKKVGI